MTAFWWIDRALPGVVASLVVTAAVWLSHVLLRRHISRTVSARPGPEGKPVAPASAAETAVFWTAMGAVILLSAVLLAWLGVLLNRQRRGGHDLRP